MSSLTGAGISFDELEKQFLKRQIKGMPVQEDKRAGGGAKDKPKGGKAAEDDTEDPDGGEDTEE